MRIGVLADIHGHVANLKKAIDRLNREQVDRFVVLGDLIYERTYACETVAMLKDCGAVGVWGNHDLGLCVDPDDEIRGMFTDNVMQYFATLQPRLELGDFLFSHTLPHQDASDTEAYCLGARPHEPHALDECFKQFANRAILVGHFHRWFAATPVGQLHWDGQHPFDLVSGERYFFVVNAVLDGYTAVLDDHQNTLTPIQL